MKNNLTILMSLSILSIIAITTSLNSIYAEEKATDSDEPKFSAIQHANSGTISEINETAYTLELNDVSDKTIFFSDRPDRIIKSINTTDFIGNWSTGSDSFVVYAPNAALVVDEKDRQQDIVIIELFNPVYDSDKKVLKYEVTPDNATSINLLSEFEKSTLVLDPRRFVR
ncbi:MAG: hypothetical protein ACPKQO_11190 [Nitrososphaeraceae archaeon]